LSITPWKAVDWPLPARSCCQGLSMKARQCLNVSSWVVLAVLLQFVTACSPSYQFSSKPPEDLPGARDQETAEPTGDLPGGGEVVPLSLGSSEPPELYGPLPCPLSDARILIKKTERALRLYSAERLVRVYPISLGRDPSGDKTCQGDGRTPEGEFYVCVKNSKSRFHLSLGISYPTEEDAQRGLEDGLISQREYDAIVRGIRVRGVPAWNTALGGEIFIHGGGAAWDWTMGCIALNNRDIEELFAVVPVGTSVRIEK